jgi:two-component system LytT family response regulator
MRATIGSLEGELDPRRFVRIHRSTIVNVDHVREIQPWYNGELVVILRGGRKLTTSRSHRARLDELLGRRRN